MADFRRFWVKEPRHAENVSAKKVLPLSSHASMSDVEPEDNIQYSRHRSFVWHSELSSNRTPSNRKVTVLFGDMGERYRDTGASWGTWDVIAVHANVKISVHVK